MRGVRSVPSSHRTRGMSRVLIGNLSTNVSGSWPGWLSARVFDHQTQLQAAVKQVLYQGSTKLRPIPRIFPISHSCKLATGIHKPKLHRELLVQHKVARGAANLATLEMTLAQCSYPGEPNSELVHLIGPFQSILQNKQRFGQDHTSDQCRSTAHEPACETLSLLDIFIMKIFHLKVFVT